MSINSFLGRQEIIQILLSNDKADPLVDQKTKVLINALGALAIRIFGFPLSIPSRIRAHDVLQLVRNLPHGSIVEIGCSCGYTHTFELSRIVFPNRVLGIDIDPISIKVAQGINSVLNFGNLSFVEADINNYSEETNRFQIAFSSETLEHIENDVAVLKTIHNYLETGGWLILSLPYSPSPQEYLKPESTLTSKLKGAKLIQDNNAFIGEKHWRSGYNQESIKGKLELSGFQVQTILFSSTINVLPDTPLYFPINMLINKLSPSAIKRPAKLNVLARKGNM